MSRRRIAIALLFDGATTASVDALRRSAGLEDLDRIPPHITLVPPIDLLPDQADRVEPTVTDAASRFRPLDLTLGPVATFAPRTMTIHLAIGGDVEALGRLRHQLHVAPIARRERWPFVPHVTLVEDAPAHLVEQWLTATPAIHIEAVVGAVHVLEHLPRAVGQRNAWRPIAQAELADE